MDRNSISWPSIIYCLFGGGLVFGGGVGQLRVSWNYSYPYEGSSSHHTATKVYSIQTTNKNHAPDDNRTWQLPITYHI